MPHPATETASPSAPKHDRFPAVLFLIMLVAALWSWSLSWNAPILDRHEFRQLQTAVSAHWLKKDGFRLDYETPLFGPPSWSIPMEFPVYQWSVAQVSKITGLGLDQSGRLTSILYLLATLPAAWGLAGLAGLARNGRLLILAAVLSSPVYLFYGRAFMIESTALCFATWFLLALGRAVRDLSPRWSILATVFATLAALAKVTTFAVYCFPAAGLALWLGWPHWKARRQSQSGLIRAALLAAIPLAIATFAAKKWVQHADAVKDANPFSGFLKSTEMSSWNWGTLDQRLTLATWTEAWNNIRQFVLSEPAAVVLLICVTLVTVRARRFAIAGFLAFLAGPLLFANLYFRHDYYYAANALLLMFAAGVLLASLWNHAALPRFAKIVVLVLFFGTQLQAFYRGYGYNHRRALPHPPEIATVAQSVIPPNGVMVIYGWDWNSLIPYYAQRRAIMIPDGRENELKVLDDVIAQLPPRRVDALLIKHRGPSGFSADFVRERVKRFNLSPAPFATGVDGDLYLATDLVGPASTRMQGLTFSTVSLNARAVADNNPDKLNNDDLSKVFLGMLRPRPVKARSSFGLQVGEVASRPVVFAHPISEMTFDPPSTATLIDAEVGIVDAAYAAGSPEVTDGIGVEILETQLDGTREVIFTRLLNPVKDPGDRGPQRIQIDHRTPFAGPLVFRITPGPANNLVKDWAYWSQIEIK